MASGVPKAGEVLKPATRYRLLPLGIVSGAIWALLALAPLLILAGLSKSPAAVSNSLQGEGLHTWLICAAIWLGILLSNLGLGLLLSRRRFTLTPEGVTMKGVFDGITTVSRHDLATVTTVYTIASLMQGVVRLRYKNGSSATIDGSGLDTIALGRIVAWMNKGGAKPA